jgi:hypothetical protein
MVMITLTRRKNVIIIQEKPMVGQKPHGVGFSTSRFSEFV